MVDQQFGAVLRHLHRLTTKHGGGTLSDERLLGRFVSDRDEAAFATLVQRHGPLVLRVCRRVLGHFQDAEDAFQATFLVLARKADTLRNRRTLAGWLYGVAHRTALTSRRSAMRRRRLDSPSGPLPPESPPAAAALRELQVILDDEVQRLPEKYRTPFVLCCLEGRSREDAARELGWKEGTVSSRIASARERLQRRLSRRGIALSSVVCADALAKRVGGVPATLAHHRDAGRPRNVCAKRVWARLREGASVGCQCPERDGNDQGEDLASSALVRWPHCRGRHK